MKKNLKRRDFIKKAGIAGAGKDDTAAAVAPAIPAFFIKSRRFKFFFILLSSRKNM